MKGSTNRRKGHNAERYYCNLFKELGFEFCTTARLASRLYDNAKIDLVNLPFNLQIKAGVQKNMNPGKELFSMETAIKALFPPGDEVHNKQKLLIHKKEVGRGNKRQDEDEVVYMSKNQYQEYKNILGEEFPTVFEKVYKFELQSEFKHIVGVTYKVFEEYIIKKYYLK